MTHTYPQISPVLLPLGAAGALTEAALGRVLETSGIPSTVTVVDGGGHVVMVTRMDGAALASIETSLTKARTAVFFGQATHVLSESAADPRALSTIQTSMSMPLTFVAGGIPIADARGVVVGAVGVGGASPQQDRIAAEAAVAVWRADAS